MPILYYPNPGEVFVCNYDMVTIEPEMCKPRPVVIVTPRLRGRAKLVGVVPLSTTAPNVLQGYHCELTLETALPEPFDSERMWAKCDMFSVVSLDRLDRFKEPRLRYGGPRRWRSGRITDEQLEAVRAAVLIGLGFG